MITLHFRIDRKLLLEETLDDGTKDRWVNQPDPSVVALLRHPRDKTLFKPILQATQESLIKTREEWESNLIRSNNAMHDITGLTLDRDITVEMTHPSLSQGVYDDRKGLIRWCYRTDFPNYNTIYLWHEILHAYLPYSELSHAVIELATDNEMRVRLNGGEYPPMIGHPSLDELRSKLLPAWRAYLVLPTGQRNIAEFIQSQTPQ